MHRMNNAVIMQMEQLAAVVTNIYIKPMTVVTQSDPELMGSPYQQNPTTTFQQTLR